MIHRRIPYIVVLCLLCVAPALADGEPEPHPVLTLTDWTVEGNRLDVVIHNPDPRPQYGWLVVWFVVDDQLYGWGFDVTVPAESDRGMTILFPFEIEVLDVQLWANGLPGAVVEAPDPIVVVNARP